MFASPASFAPRGPSPEWHDRKAWPLARPFDGERLLVVGAVGVVATRAAARQIRATHRTPPTFQADTAGGAGDHGSTRQHLPGPGGSVAQKVWDNPPLWGEHGTQIRSPSKFRPASLSWLYLTCTLAGTRNLVPRPFSALSGRSVSTSTPLWRYPPGQALGRAQWSGPSAPATCPNREVTTISHGFSRTACQDTRSPANPRVPAIQRHRIPNLTVRVDPRHPLGIDGRQTSATNSEMIFLRRVMHATHVPYAGRWPTATVTATAAANG